MNNQEAFNQAIKGLASQGFKPAVNISDYGNAHCKYYSHEGARCAVGWLLTEDEARSLPDGTVTEIWENLPSTVQSTDEDFLISMQEAHDDAVVDQVPLPSALKKNMARLAKQWQLDLPPELTA